MKIGEAQLRTLARLALLLVLACSIGLLSGISDDGDDNFGIASLSPSVTHSAASPHSARSGVHNTQGHPFTGVIKRLTSLLGSSTSKVMTEATPSLIVPLRT